MAIGSGLGSQFGFSAETTWATRVAPAKFLRAKTYTLSRTSGETQGEGIQTGNFGDLASQYVEPISGGAGQVTLDVPQRGAGVIWNTLMGGTVTPVLISGTSYTGTFPLADTLNKSMTVQTGNPRRDGTVVVHELTGTKVIGAEFTCGMGEILTCSLDLDAKAWSDAQTLATAAYSAAAPNDNPFSFRDMAVKIGTFGAEAAVTGVRGINVKIDRPHDTADYNANTGGLKSQQVLNGATQITGSISADWLDKATFQDRANTTATTSMVVEFVQATAVSGANFPTFRLTIPGVIFTQTTQGVEGRQELTHDWSFRWAYDGTNQPTIATISADSTL